MMREKKLFLPQRSWLYIAKRKKLDLFVNMSTGVISLFPLSFLLYLFFTIFSNTYFALHQTVILIDNINYTETSNKNTRQDVLESLRYSLADIITDITINEVISMFSTTAIHDFHNAYEEKKDSIWLLASSEFDTFFKRFNSTAYDKNTRKYLFAESLNNANRVKKVFNTNLFLNADSRDPTVAGVLGVAIGSLFTIFVCSLVSIPIGVMAAFCTEELMPKNRFTSKILSFFDISVSNLASTPAVIYGILGLLLFVNFLNLPRSSALVGGLTLAFIMLPTMIITTKQAILTVPKSIKEAAIAMGASKMQLILHHILPLSMPLIITGSILGIARVIGESAPLLMIGMVAFVADIPHSIFEPATVFPIQIFLWASSPEPALIEKTSAVIMLLFIVLFMLNKLAYFVKKTFYVRFI